MRTRLLLKGLFLSLFFIAFTTHATPTPQNKLIQASYLGEFTEETAALVLKKSPPLDTLAVHYALELYRIEYRTPAPDGSEAVASGLVVLPKNPEKPVGIVTYLHGTRFERNDVPSRNNQKNYMYLAAFSSSGGYAAVMPDYLGLGDSNLNLHPYVQAETLASSSIDMLLAAKEFFKQSHYPINEKLYLAGYSEGGFTTIVMFEKLIKDYPHIPITAVAAGSAPYDWLETMKFVMFKPGPRATAYLAYFFYSLQTYKHYWASMDEIFLPPFNTLIPQLFDGQHNTQEVLQALPPHPLQILQPNLIGSIIYGDDPHTEDLIMNFNHYYFIPTAPL
ncbi:MAG: alpha/beta hydrolase, partial [Legionella sp.]